MKSEKEIRNRIDKLTRENKTLRARRLEGFSFPMEQRKNANEIRVRDALIVGLKWVLKNE